MTVVEENIVELTRALYGSLVRWNMDSKEVAETIIQMAYDFETVYDPSGDYYTQIENYAKERWLE